MALVELEVSGGGYARQTGAFTISSGTASNSSAIEYSNCNYNYGTVRLWEFTTQLLGGNLLAYILQHQR